jgi:hypothetical protein
MAPGFKEQPPESFEEADDVRETIPAFCDLLPLNLDLEKNYADFIAARYGTYHP